MEDESKSLKDGIEVDQGSPVEINRRIKKIDNNEMDNWVTCCYKCNKNAVVFFSQLVICSSVVCFCMVQLFRSETCNQDALYSGIMMVILGAFLPTPKIRKNM